MDFDALFGILDKPVYTDDFLFEDVKGAECLGKVRECFRLNYYSLIL